MAAAASHATAPTATNTVLSTPELLSQILILVNQKHLLTSGQRVCKLWLHVIKESPILRQYLFLHDYAIGTNPRGRQLNSLLADTFPDWFSTVIDTELPEAELEFFARHHRIDKLRKTTASLYQLSRTEICKAGRESPLLRINASWMQMQVSDPPTTALAVHRIKSLSTAQQLYEEKRYYPSGLRMLDFFLLALHSFCNPGEFEPYFRVIWPQSGSCITHDHVTRAHCHWFPFFGVGGAVLEGERELTDAQVAKKFQDFDAMHAGVLIQFHQRYSVSDMSAANERQRHFVTDCGLSFFNCEYSTEFEAAAFHDPEP